MVARSPSSMSSSLRDRWGPLGGAPGLRRATQAGQLWQPTNPVPSNCFVKETKMEALECCGRGDRDSPGPPDQSDVKTGAQHQRPGSYY